MRVILLLALAACEGDKYVDTGKIGFQDHLPKDSGGDEESPSGDSDETGGGGESAETGDSSGNSYTPVDCEEELPDPPDDYVYVDLGSSEDFAFDAEGWVWHVDDRGNLVKDDADGNREIIRPSIGAVAGTRFLPSGDLVIADVTTGSIQRITPEGGITTLMSGIAYPNGLEVGKDGYIYVTDQTRGQVLKVDADSGEYQVIAEDLYSPNGITFGPDQQTLYIGSFGGGVVYRLDRDGEGWARPELHAGLEGSFAYHLPPCEGLSEGDVCFQSNNGGPGFCVPSAEDGELDCVHEVDREACEGLSITDPCVTTLLGEDYLSQCMPDADYELFCPAVEADRLGGCTDEYSVCTYDGKPGYCYPSFEDIYVCIGNDEYMSFYQTCDGLEIGDSCVVNSPATPAEGVCADWSAWGYPEPVCSAGGYYVSPDGGGGFDAIGVDECGNVYIGEYVTARVYRWTESGEDPEVIADFESGWIPNMHWGVGVGGWQKDYLYVMDRGRGGLFGLDLDLLGHGEPYPPEE